MLKGGARVDTRDGNGATPLIVHAQHERVEVVRTLLHLKANVDLQDKLGYSALIVSSKKGNLELVCVLISAGSVLDFKEKEVGVVYNVLSVV